MASRVLTKMPSGSRPRGQLEAQPITETAMLWTLFIMGMWAGGMINTSMMVGVFLSYDLLP